VPGKKLLEVMGDGVTQEQAFAYANDVLKNAVGGISDVIQIPGLVNVDFEDVKTVMSEPGTAMMGTAVAGGPDRDNRDGQLLEAHVDADVQDGHFDGCDVALDVLDHGEHRLFVACVAAESVRLSAVGRDVLCCPSADEMHQFSSPIFPLVGIRQGRLALGDGRPAGCRASSAFSATMCS
jgi:hypothetical protein